MNPKYKKIYCCTPVAFHANDGFFIRDTGLISNTLRSMGVESKCIMPLPFYEDDQTEHLIRTEYKNLKSVAWWKSLGIDALVLYSWGAPRYLPIARAIRKAGIKLVIHMDTSGDFEGWQWSSLSTLKKAYKYLKLQIQDILRSYHMRQANHLTMSLPTAHYISKRMFYGNWVIEKLFPMACPTSPNMIYNKTNKEDIILSIGRWDDEQQKRSEMLMKTLDNLYREGCNAKTHVLGNITEKMKRWHSQLTPETAEKIMLIGYIDNHRLKEEYNSAKIVLCTSNFESSHIVSAEGLCCGCSVVTPNRPIALCAIHWYTTKNSGTIAKEDTPESLANALQQELREWEQGHRDPQAIAAAWQPYFHVDKVFNNIFK